MIFIWIQNEAKNKIQNCQFDRTKLEKFMAIPITSTNKSKKEIWSLEMEFCPNLIKFRTTVHRQYLWIYSSP